MPIQTQFPSTFSNGLASISDSFDRPNGSLGAPWLGGSNWAIIGNALSSTPNLGSELAGNGEFTSSIASWTAQNGATLTQRDSSITPGVASGGANNGCLEILNTGTSNAQALQTVPLTANCWYRVAARAYSPSANTQVGSVILNSSGFNLGSVDQATEDIWQELKFTARSTGASANLILRCEGSTNGDKAYYDAVTVKQLTLSELLNLFIASRADASASAGVTISGKMCAGVALNWDRSTNPQNGVLFYIDGTKYYLDKCVAGVWSNVANGNISYSPGNGVKVIKNGTTYTMFYGTIGSEAQVGTPQTISDGGIINNVLHGIFDTDSANLVDSFFLNL